MTNKEWLDYLAHNAPDELSAWFDAERITNQAEMLHMPESPTSGEMVAELQAQVYELTAERDNAREESVELYSDLVKASDEREHYREKCSKIATKIHDALMVMDERMA